jgi:2-polyprenyl-3-methyl-5-hydroxy-6-metoxy-1,4-benzoquinol methylase
MEVKEDLQREYNPAHPNFERWQKARDISEDRAKFVERILSTKIELKGLKILDFGSGEGSTSELLSKDNTVVSIDIKPERVKMISKSDSLQPILSNGLNLPLKSNSLDVIILQDVIEHIPISGNFFEYLSKFLKENGIIYLSTPNKLSLFNIISDPHWGLPLLSLFNRNQIKKYFLQIFRKADSKRDDIAELLSLKKLMRLINKNFNIEFQTNFAVKYLLNGGKGLIWSDFHKGLIKVANLSLIRTVLLNISNDKTGLVNNIFTPTFYIILKKK